MTNGIRFGKIETLTYHNGQVESVEESIQDYVTTHTCRRYTVTVFGDNKKKVTAEVLVLIDRLSDDSVSNISFEVDKKQGGSKYYIKASWVVK